MMANMASHSIEVTEAEEPIQLLCLRVRAPTRPVPASIRGGVPFRRDYQASSRGRRTLQVRSDRRDPPAVRPLWRQPGGRRRSNYAQSAGREPHRCDLESKFTMTIKKGDIFRHVLAGAGGWGDPLERDPDAKVLKRRAQRAAVGRRKRRRRLRRDRRHHAYMDRRRDGDRQMASVRRFDSIRGWECRAQGATARSTVTIKAPLRYGPRNERAFRVGVDIGGTFTDIVLLGADGTLHTKKISSSVGNYAEAQSSRA